MGLQQLSTREEERERKKEGNEAGEGCGRVLSAAARLSTKPKFTFGEFGLWGAWLPQTARGRFCNMTCPPALLRRVERLGALDSAPPILVLLCPATKCRH